MWEKIIDLILFFLIIVWYYLKILKNELKWLYKFKIQKR